MRGLMGQTPRQKVAVCTGQLAGESFAFMSNHTVFTVEEDLEVVSKLDFLYLDICYTGPLPQF